MFEVMDGLRSSDVDVGTGRSYTKEEQNCMEDLANKLFAFGLLHPNRHHATLNTLTRSAITTTPPKLQPLPTPVSTPVIPEAIPPVVPPVFQGAYGVVPRVLAWQQIPSMMMMMGSSDHSHHRAHLNGYGKKSNGTGVFLPRTAGRGNRRKSNEKWRPPGTVLNF